jgi:hypothetical protein
MLGSKIGRDTGYLTWGFCSFLQSIQGNAGIVPKFGYDRFLPKFFNSFIHQSYDESTRRCMRSIDTDGVVNP